MTSIQQRDGSIVRTLPTLHDVKQMLEEIRYERKQKIRKAKRKARKQKFKESRRASQDAQFPTEDAVPDVVGVCAICTTDMETGHELTVTPCNHSFHKDCIDEWVSYCGKKFWTVTCPMCRSEMPDEVA
jgi:hypothetical protein